MRLGALVLAVLCLAVSASIAAEAPSGRPTLPVVHLLNEGYVPGELRDSGPFQDAKAGASLRWQSPLFANPFEFSLAGVNAVHFPPPAKPIRAIGDYCFELEHGDVLFGALAGLTENELDIDAARIGRLHIQRKSLQRFFRWRDSADVIYLGPQGLVGWNAAPAGVWREEFGQLTTNQEGSLRGDFGLPDRAAIEFEISWKKKPDFVLALGTAGDAKTHGSSACQFEVWGDEIVVLRDVVLGDKEGRSDLASVSSAVPAPATPGASSAGSLHLHVFIDQKQGRCLVYSSGGVRLADLNVASDKPQVLPGIRLENKRGDIRLERLRIARWAGDLPREVEAGQPRVHMTDGTIAYGLVTGYDAQAKQFLVRDKTGESKVSADLLDSAFLSFPPEADPAAARGSFRADAQAAAAKIRGDVVAAPARAMFRDGTQVSGDIVKVADGALWINSPAVTEPVRLGLADLRSVIALRYETAPAQNAADTEAGKDAAANAEKEGRLGTLELEGIRLQGRLVDGQEQPGASCLVWQPVGSKLGAAIRPGISGRIVYQERAPAPKPVPQPTAAMGGAVRVRVANPNVKPAAPARAAAKRAAEPSLYLLTGDTIPCQVTAIDENGVSFKTALLDSNFVAHDKIKAVELVRESTNAPGLTKVKKERLLTLPRMQRESPPTHLIRSHDGDYLRGRLIGMDDNRLQVEIRLEVKEIPRDRVARIIWLHAEDLAQAALEDPSERKTAASGEGAKLTPAEEKIKRALDKPTTLEFVDLSLEDGLNFIHEYHAIKISVNKQALQDEGIALDAPITLKVAGISLRAALDAVLEPLQLTYVIDNDALLITTAGQAKGKQKPKAEESAAFQAPPPDPQGRTRVQIIRSDENQSRLTFYADSFSLATLSGTSDVLGPCRVSLAQIDQLLIGQAIEQAAAKLDYQQWKMQNAVDPKFAQAGEGGEDADAGTESQLVGKPAPLFELDLLSGGRFKLAEQKGHVVVLDFWATWCGPCLAAMPQVDRAARDFKDQGVQLVAVNLEEAPKPIQSMLERHKLDLTVALDRDGVVAGKYQATAIPQTVIIDREGKIVRVFIGGSAHLEEQIRAALKSVLGDSPAQKPAP